MYIDKNFPEKICCANCKKEVGIMDLHTKIVDVTHCRLLKLTPIEFRLQCKQMNIHRHDHDYQTILRLMDESTKIILPVRFSFYNHRGERMHKMCHYLLKKKSAFFDEISTVMEKKNLIKNVKVNKSLFTLMKEEVIKEGSVDVIVKRSGIKESNDIVGDIIVKAMQMSSEKSSFDHDYIESSVIVRNEEPIAGTSYSFYGEVIGNESETKIENVPILTENRNSVINIENDSTMSQNSINSTENNLIMVQPSVVDIENNLSTNYDKIIDTENVSIMNQDPITESIASANILTSDCFSDITVENFDWDLVNEVLNLNDVDMDAFNQFDNNIDFDDTNVKTYQLEFNGYDRIVNNDVMMCDASISQ